MVDEIFMFLHQVCLYGLVPIHYSNNYVDLLKELKEIVVTRSCTITKQSPDIYHMQPIRTTYIAYCDDLITEVKLQSTWLPQRGTPIYHPHSTLQTSPPISLNNINRLYQSRVPQAPKLLLWERIPKLIGSKLIFIPSQLLPIPINTHHQYQIFFLENFPIIIK